jgi:hypothetical protein
MDRSCPPFLSPPADKAIAAPPAAMASHRRRQPPSQQRRQSRASATGFCSLIVCWGEGGGADDKNYSTPSSTSMQSSSAAVAAEDDPTQRLVLLAFFDQSLLGCTYLVSWKSSVPPFSVDCHICSPISCWISTLRQEKAMAQKRSINYNNCARRTVAITYRVTQRRHQQ